MIYNQFCPISKAMEVLGEKWTLLIIRELLLGSTRFNELQRGLCLISPTVLTKRLAYLEETGLIIRKRIPGQRGYEYFPTESCKELFPVLEQIGVWGMRWVQDRMTDDDYDLELLMLYLERSIQPDQLVGRETVIKFNFTDAKEFPEWWCVVTGDQVEVCTLDPGKDVDIYFTLTVPLMCQLWMQQKSYRQAVADGSLTLVGPKTLTSNVEKWLKPGTFAGIPPANLIMLES